MLDRFRAPGAIANACRKMATVVAFGVITALLLGALGRFFWPFDLLTHFRVHYVALLVCAGLVLMGVREWRSGLLALLAAVFVAVPTFEYVQPASHASVGTQPSLKVLSINAWFRNDDLTELTRYVASSEADILVLQELSEPRARKLAAELGMFAFHHLESAAATDTVLFSRWPIEEASIVPLASDGTSALNAVIDWRGTEIKVMAVHLHWPIGPRSSARRNHELQGIAALAQAEREPLLVVGDFNITAWSSHFTSMLEAARLRDCAVGHGLQPTWPSHVRPIGIRIDQCLMSAHWRARDVWTGPHIGSDHRPMGVELELQ